MPEYGEESRRSTLFETDIEKHEIGLNQILDAILYLPTVHVAANVFYPTAFLLNKLSDQLRSTIERMIIYKQPSATKDQTTARHDSSPGRVARRLAAYMEHVANIDIRLRLDLLLVMKETLGEVREGEICQCGGVTDCDPSPLPYCHI